MQISIADGGTGNEIHLQANGQLRKQIMTIEEAIKYLGKNAVITCTDGDVLTGRIRTYQTKAEELEEPESIFIDFFDAVMQIPVEEIEKITVI